MHTTPGVLVELLNLPQGSSQEWSDWYDHTYLKARAQIPGVVAARRGSGVVGSVQNIVVYDLSDFLIPYGADWVDVDRTMAVQSPVPSGLTEPLAAIDSLVYRQIFSADAGDYHPEVTEILHGAFFEVESRDQDEFNDWYNSEHIEFIKTVEGYLNCRRFQAYEKPSKFVALYDVVSLANSEVKDAAGPNFSPWAVRVRAKLATYSERRLFQIERREQGQR